MFYSKGAVLVLLWTLLKGITISSILSVVQSLGKPTGTPRWLSAIPATFGILGTIVSGWLADAKLGNYKVLKYSLVVQFLTTLSFSIYTLIPVSIQNRYVIEILYCFVGSLFLICLAASSITSLQLGLDQMPDASSSSISSFIVWFIFSLLSGYWLGDILTSSCTNDNVQLSTLIPVVCSSLSLTSDLIFSKKWLIIEPKSPQSLKTMYQVLKFAWKHKSPLNRSALTYWEEDIPSRMDLGKLRFGGPFTTEQVENVKTIFRLFLLSFSLYVISFSLGIRPHIWSIFYPQNWSYCNSYFLFMLTYNSWLCVGIDTLIHEFILYPMTKYKNFSILKRIGIISLLITIFSCLFLVLELLHHFLLIDDYLINTINTVLYSVLRGFLLRILMCTSLELICAQAPYNMRGLFAGCAVFVFLVSFATGALFNHFPKTTRLEMIGAKVVISLFGLGFYCLLARWYKMRVRDEQYDVHRVVEEVYDRYLSARDGN